MTAAEPLRLRFVDFATDGKTAGRRWYYFRTKETGRVKLPGEPGTAAFQQAYADALAMRERIRAGKPSSNDTHLDWLIDRYLTSAEFRALSDATQLDYSRTCDLLKGAMGDQPFRFITRSMVKVARDDHADTVRKANKIAAIMSLIYGWANQADLVPDGVNPAAGLKKLKRKGGVREYVPWSDQELAWMLAAAPLHVQTPMLIALYTGQRREDVAAMTWQQDQGEILRVRTSKTRALIDLPCHPGAARAPGPGQEGSEGGQPDRPDLPVGRRQAVQRQRHVGAAAAPGRKAPAGAQQPRFMGFAMRPRRGWKKAARRWRRS
jgi:integrase